VPQHAHPQASLVTDWFPGPTVAYPVPVQTIDDAIAEFGRPAFCKIDVEGFELEVLRGMSAAIPAVSFEYHLSPKDKAKVVDCLDYLGRLGPIRINYLGDGMLALGRRDWSTPDAFIPFFLHDLEKDGGFFGDIFVRFGDHANSRPPWSGSAS